MSLFFKNVLANIVAFIAIIIGIFGFFSFMIFVSTLFEDEKIEITENSVLLIKIDQPIIESENEKESSLFNFKSQNNLKYLDIINAVENAATDENIVGISLEFEGANIGNTQIDNLRSALNKFKSKGKFVYAYGNGISQSEYYLASIADQIFLNPMGGVELKGLGTEIMMYKDLFAKYGIGANIIRHGKYKAAVEPFILNKISDENRLQTQTLLDDIWANKFSEISIARKIKKNELKTTVDSLFSLIPDLALKNKLVDKLMHYSEYSEILKSKLNLDSDEEINSINIKDYASSIEKTSNSDKIAILYASGQIYEGKGTNGIYSENFIEDIKEIAEDDNIKALVLRVNSPGGSANASDEILHELIKLREKKPIIVSFGDYAASGGYYISMAANKIYSEPNCITGSIGVFGMMFDGKKLAQEQGISTDLVTTNANSVIFSPINGIGEHTKSIMQRNVEYTYNRFVDIVSKNRKLTTENVDKIGGGRVWSGTRAKSIGLVNELGSLKDALKYAQTLVKLKDFSVETFPKKNEGFDNFMKSLNQTQIFGYFMKKEMGENNYNLYQKIKSTKPNEIQMLMPFEIEVK